jgi:hypothetical protein
MKNERGFGLVGFLVLIPLILSIVATVSAVTLAFKANAHLKHECRVSVLNSQRDAADKLKQLMRMNHEAEILRLQYQVARAALKAAQASGYVPAIAAAQSAYGIVQFRRHVFSAQQNALIIRGKAISYAAPLHARGAVMSGLQQEVHANKVTPPSTRTSWRPGKFNVKATPEGDLTPDYNPADSFTKDQIVDVDVIVDAASLLPEWLRKMLPEGKLQISSHCQATIEKQESEWVETLNAVR